MGLIFKADQAALRAVVEGIPECLERECPDCRGWGYHVLAGEGPLGANVSFCCETCDGRGSLPEEDAE